MAKKKSKKDFNKLIMNVAKAAGGGIGAEILADTIVQNSPELIEKNPKITEIIPIAGGTALLYFMGEEMAPVGYGMIGAGAAGFADDIMGKMQGFQRVQYLNGQISQEMNAGIRMIEEMQGLVFESGSSATGFGDLADDDMEMTDYA